MIANIVLLLFALMFNGVEASNGKQDLSKRDIFDWATSFLIYKGTKWCGPGNIANSYDDLGEARETDKCCRTHDKHCEARIERFSKKYGLWNGSWKTASHCKCEERFKDCLLNVNTKASKEVYNIYFGIIEPRCIRFKEEKYCVYWSWGICQKYAKKAYFVYRKDSLS